MDTILATGGKTSKISISWYFKYTGLKFLEFFNKPGYNPLILFNVLDYFAAINKQLIQGSKQIDTISLFVALSLHSN